MNIFIRNATVEDALDMGTLHTLSWQVAYKGIIDQNYLDAIDAQKRIEKWREIIENKTPTQTILVAELNGKIIGFASGNVHEEYKGRYFIQALYLHPSYFNKGLGVPLLEGFKKATRKLGYDKMACTVLKENKRARRVYEREGGVHQKRMATGFQTSDGHNYLEEVYFFDI